MANGKLFSSFLAHGEDSNESLEAEKLYVPYATPIGFNTRVERETTETWREISNLIQRHREG